jgi:hypothetical protein
MKEFKVILTDEEYRAFNLIVPDADEWVDNAVRNKARKCLIYVAERTAQNIDNLLDPADRAEIEADMLAAGDVMKAPKHYSDAVKKKIAAKTKLKTRVERDAEEMAAMTPPVEG